MNRKIKDARLISSDKEQARAPHARLISTVQTNTDRHASVVKQLIDYATLSVGLEFIRFVTSLASTLG